MAIRCQLTHSSIYKYDKPIGLGSHVVRLRPAPHCRTPIVDYALRVSPAGHFCNWLQDPYGNFQARLVFQEKTDLLKVEVQVIADMVVINPFDFFLDPDANQIPFTYNPELLHDLSPYLKKEPLTPKLAGWVDEWRNKTGITINMLLELNTALRQTVDYVIRMDPGVQTPEETLEIGRGSCRDSAWLLVQILRQLGLAARFTSGYLVQLASDDPSLDGPDAPTTDFIDLHAWCEVYLPGAGWVGLDATSGLLAAEGHIPLASTPYPSGAAPITGTHEIASVEFSHHMSVTRLMDPPRPTRPYSDDQWSTINACGLALDKRLAADEVLLRQGGEPTFISMTERDAETWNGAAVGGKKRRYAADFLQRLRARFCPGGLPHIGQGKWYPGEPLPRWSMTLYWRLDGKPVWRNDELLADPEVAGDADQELAGEFIRDLAKRLLVDPGFVREAYEDPWEYLAAEQRLPVGMDPRQSDLSDPGARERMARIFEEGLDRPRGWLLPLDRRRFSPARWVSGPWRTRSSYIILVPGDSPMGLRLPMDSLPPVDPKHAMPVLPVDPTTVVPSITGGRRQRQTDTGESIGEIAQRQVHQLLPTLTPPGPAITGIPADLQGAPSERIYESTAVDNVRTALCVEAREGRLYVFMPPTRNSEDYLDLLAAVEDTADALDAPVVVEGYTPPHDSRIQSLRLTPDPGVIEVNIHPVDSWRELESITRNLYADATAVGLCAEKYMLDGRPMGSGGGAHITFGGPTPLDSPFLRRPDLLRSVIAAFVNHPSLSYIFSGMFIGPTSQAPRLDEGRMETLDELELAFCQIPDDPDAEIPPQLVDRIFRHLLVDITGNTHRTELCIDKLYSPDHAAGRLGILELRGFEMPPHWQMALSQQLLVRALVAHYWRNPWSGSLRRWERALHDRFLLPAYLEHDLHALISELNSDGLDLQTEWYAPQIALRFPVLGEVTIDDMRLEIRAGLEPWFTLGEQPAGGATSRYVDSSVERLQVRLDGDPDARYAVLCNGRRVPLSSLGATDCRVAGVRYRAWQPPECLHPTIKVQTPLVFDLVDLKTGRVVGGCRYHVGHPGGRNYETQPVNSREAEARRRARFEPHGHRTGKVSIPPLKTGDGRPHTLDLRT